MRFGRILSGPPTSCSARRLASTRHCATTPLRPRTGSAMSASVTTSSIAARPALRRTDRPTVRREPQACGPRRSRLQATIVGLAPHSTRLLPTAVPTRQSVRTFSTPFAGSPTKRASFWSTPTRSHYDIKVGERRQVLGFYSDIAWNAGALAVVFIAVRRLAGLPEPPHPPAQRPLSPRRRRGRAANRAKSASSQR